MLDFDEYPITEEEVIAILGNNYKVQGDEIVWRCPACPGGDKHGDNLKYNRVKRVLKCFACDFGAEVTGIIARRRYEAERGNGEVTPTTPVYSFERKTPIVAEVAQPREKEIPENELDVYYWECMVNLLKNKDVLREMYKKHTILPRTAMACGIGYDTKKDCLVFPSKAIGKDLTTCLSASLKPNGAEYREYCGEDKIIRRIAGYEPKICCVKCPDNDFVTEAIICEGYKDAYNLIQILMASDPKRLSYTAICTVQNGTNSINTNNCLQKTNWNNLDKVYLLMDNDSAGDKAIETAKELFPQMIDYRKEFLGYYNDIQEMFKDKYADKIDIDKALNANWLNEWQNE